MTSNGTPLPTKTRLSHRMRRFGEKYGPWAVVTGASSGIGRAIAIRLAETGVNLVLASRGRESLEQLTDELTSKHQVECRVVAVDLGQIAGVELLQEATQMLEVGLLVTAAGFGTSGSFLDGALDDELDMLAVNCQSVAALVWHFGRRFRTRGRGGVIMLSSIVGFQGAPNAAHYSATKAYIQALAEALHVELAGQGVDVLAAAPGPVASGFAARAKMTMGKALTPESVAGPILDALGRSGTVLPGLLSKVLVYSMTGLPRWVKVRIMGRVMHGMSQRS
jgi:short-subunit dehydrogenase